MPTTSECRADFLAEPTKCDGPTRVEFTDHSTGNITDWAWDLDGDVMVDSTARNPVYWYDIDGSYSVTLTITGPDCEDTLTKRDYIYVAGCDTCGW